MSEHTPGPWHWTTSGRLAASVASGKLVALGGSEDDILVPKKADACLIATAPDLLAALETITDIEDGHDGTHPFACPACQRVDLARAAIAKAKGEA